MPYVAGLDKLKVSLWLDWDTPDFLQMLRDFKEEFNDEKLCGPEVSERALDLGWEGVSFNMQRAGAGKYPYKLQSGDIVLLFSNHKSTAPFPCCRIEIGSMSCWNPGWQHLFDRFAALLRHWGGSIRKQKIMQFDITANLMEVDFTRTGLINIHRWIARAQDQNPRYKNYIPNYVSFGKGDFMFKAYDKTAELKDDDVKREFFHQLWTEHLGHVPEHVTRLEFQVRRADELDISTVGQLAEKLDAVWRYCVGSDDDNGWVRFCARRISAADRRNKNQQRYPVAFLWEFVRSVRFGAGRTLKLARKKLPPKRNVLSLQKTAAGCLLSICAILGMHPDNLDGHIVQSFNIIDEKMRASYKKNRTEYIRKIETRYNSAFVSLS